MKMNFAGRTLDMTQCHVMGVLNVTPDSFSDGGRFDRPQQALAHARQMVEDGARFIDVGGESTRPGAKPVSLQQELDRVCPAVEAIAGELDVVISVDTSSPQVMTQAAALGAGLINDVRALTREGALQAAANTGLPVCLMHSQGEPDTMQNNRSIRMCAHRLVCFWHSGYSRHRTPALILQESCWIWVSVLVKASSTICSCLRGQSNLPYWGILCCWGCRANLCWALLPVATWKKGCRQASLPRQYVP